MIVIEYNILVSDSLTLTMLDNCKKLLRTCRLDWKERCECAPYYCYERWRIFNSVDRAAMLAQQAMVDGLVVP